MNAYGVDVFHTADGDSVVASVTHNLKLDLLVALNALLDKNLIYGRKTECVSTNLDELFLIVSKSAAGTAKGECGTKNYGVADALCRFLSLVEVIGDLGGDNGLADGLAKLLEELAVLCSLDRLARSTEKLNAAFLENALLLELHCEVESGLSAYSGKDSIGTLIAKDLCDIFKCKRLHIDLVRNGGIGHNGRGVGVYEYDLVSFLFERETRLSARVVKFRSLTDYDRSRADNENFLQVCSFCHVLSPVY